MRSSFLSCALAVAIMIGLSVVAAAQSTAPVLENEHVRVTRTELPKGAILPDDNKYDMLDVQLDDGETALLEPGQLEKNASGRAGDAHFFVAESRRSIRNIGKRTITFIQVQFQRPQGKYVAFEVPQSHYCNPGQEKACVTERYLFCTDHFCAESVTVLPGAESTQHTHDADYIVIATSDFVWRNEPVGKPAVEERFKAGDVHYIPAGGSHRLINTGNTTARLFVIQFK